MGQLKNSISPLRVSVSEYRSDLTVDILHAKIQRSGDIFFSDSERLIHANRANVEN